MKVEPNRLSGIPEGAKVIVNGERAEPVKGELLIAVDSDEAVDVRVYREDEDVAVFAVPCTPAGNPAKGGHRVLQDYARLRLGAEGYPSIADQLDALWKGGAEEAAMRARVAAVKARFPKDRP